MMYIRFDMLRRKSSSSIIDDEDENNYYWTDFCAGIFKEFMSKAKSMKLTTASTAASNKEKEDSSLHLSEFQKSYISFPEFNESNISELEATTATYNNKNDATTTNASHYWLLSNSPSFQHHQ